MPASHLPTRREAGGGWSGAPGSGASLQASLGRGARAQGSDAHPRDFLNIFCLGKREPEIPGVPPPAKSPKPGSPQVPHARIPVYGLQSPPSMHSVLQSAPLFLRASASAAAAAAAAAAPVAPSSVPCAAGCCCISCLTVVIARTPVAVPQGGCCGEIFSKLCLTAEWRWCFCKLPAAVTCAQGHLL